MVIDLSLTRGKGEQFDFETIQKLRTQKLNYNYQVAEQKRQRTLAENQKRALARQNELLAKVQIIESESETINLDFADKISKIIPYSLIPIIPIAVAYFVFKGSK
tara:strand:- start:700 stop:1014 length:315 start_codon:yes stop_codon:yes gene_type:complete